MYTVHIHICRQNTHVHEIINLKGNFLKMKNEIHVREKHRYKAKLIFLLPTAMLPGAHHKVSGIVF